MFLRLIAPPSLSESDRTIARLRAIVQIVEAKAKVESMAELGGDLRERGQVLSHEQSELTKLEAQLKAATEVQVRGVYRFVGHCVLELTVVGMCSQQPRSAPSSRSSTKSRP